MKIEIDEGSVSINGNHDAAMSPSYADLILGDVEMDGRIMRVPLILLALELNDLLFTCLTGAVAQSLFWETGESISMAHDGQGHIALSFPVGLPAIQVTPEEIAGVVADLNRLAAENLLTAR